MSQLVVVFGEALLAAIRKEHLAGESRAGAIAVPVSVEI